MSKSTMFGRLVSRAKPKTKKTMVPKSITPKTLKRKKVNKLKCWSK